MWSCHQDFTYAKSMRDVSLSCRTHRCIACSTDSRIASLIIFAKCDGVRRTRMTPAADPCRDTVRSDDDDDDACANAKFIEHTARYGSCPATTKGIW
jgi:hypothetical protein